MSKDIIDTFSVPGSNGKQFARVEDWPAEKRNNFGFKPNLNWVLEACFGNDPIFERDDATKIRNTFGHLAGVFSSESAKVRNGQLTVEDFEKLVKSKTDEEIFKHQQGKAPYADWKELPIGKIFAGEEITREEILGKPKNEERIKFGKL